MKYKMISLARKLINKKIEELEETRERRAMWDTEEARYGAFLECERIIANIIRRQKRRDKKEEERDEETQES